MKYRGRLSDDKPQVGGVVKPISPPEPSFLYLTSTQLLHLRADDAMKIARKFYASRNKNEKILKMRSS